MEGRTRRYGPRRESSSQGSSLERTGVWTEPFKQQQQTTGRRIPVVYYLCRNNHLEHPHFIEVPISSPEGLYLRDVINRLNAVRGKGMASRYSWSCKRSYKNGFVWHDLSEDDLVLPAQGDEYILKGSELLDKSPPDRVSQSFSVAKISSPKHPQQEQPATLSRTQETSSSSTSPKTQIKESKHIIPHPPPSPHSQDNELSPRSRGAQSSGNVSPEPLSVRLPSWEAGYPSSAEYKLNRAIDAATQTEDIGEKRSLPQPVVRPRVVSVEDETLDLELEKHCWNRSPKSDSRSEIRRADMSPTPASSSTPSFRGKTETLGSLIRADINKMNSVRILDEEQVFVAAKVRQKAVDILMQLITCGAISVKDHQSFGLVPTYKPIYAQAGFSSPLYSASVKAADRDHLSENWRITGKTRIEDKDNFSGSLIEIKKHKVEAANGATSLKRSSSFNADRNCTPDPVDEDKVVDSASLKCLPRTIKIMSGKQSKGVQIMSPSSDGARTSSARPDSSPSVSLRSPNRGSKTITDTSSLKGSSVRLESFKKENEKVIKIEERLTSGARVIIHSTALSDNGEYKSSF